MDQDFASQVQDLFSEATEVDPAQRVTLLDARCAGKPGLRREVESLLASHDRLGSFLHVAPPLVSQDQGLEGHRQPRVGQIVGHYRLLERIALGSMGAVYRAEDLALGRETAIKLLPPVLNVEVRQSVFAEAEASARLQHPAIATFYEAGEADGESFIAMEFVHGQTLRDRLRNGPLNVTDALALTGCLLEALAHAHAAGLLHRDIKPENIVVIDRTFAKLLDFGIAVPLTSLDVPRAGTVGYLAPEQVAGAPLDARTDVFQVGVVLYEMLTGRPLFGGESPLQRLAAAMKAPDLTALDAAAPKSIAAIVQRATAPDPHARFGSAAAFLRAIREPDVGHHPAITTRAVAVADFENQTGNEQLAWIASAVAEGIHNDFTGVPNLSVTPRRQFAQELVRADASTLDPITASLRLGCGWLVDGEVQTLPGGHLRITARLVEVATGRVACSHEERGAVETLVNLQRSLAATLATELSGTVVAVAEDPNRGTTIEAHGYFSRARLLIEGFGKGSLEDARELLERAVAIDPMHVEALGALTATYGLRAIAAPTAADYEQALVYADRALGIDDRHLRSWVWKSYALAALGRHAEAAACTRRALEIDPYDTEALYFAAGTRLFWQEPPAVGEALTLLRRAVERDATRGMWWLALGAAHSLLGHDREALYSYTRAERLEGSPTRFNTAGAAAHAGESLRRLHRLDEARTAAFRGLEAAERSDHAYRDSFRMHALVVIGRVALDQGKPDAAEAAYQQVLAQARGRPQPRASGHFVVQALCGLARATQQTASLDEAYRVFRNREPFNFTRFYGAVDADTVGELARAASALGREEEASHWHAQVAVAPGE